MLAWAIDVFSAAHLAATVLERDICSDKAKPQASIDVGCIKEHVGVNEASTASTKAGGVATAGDALDSNKQYGYTKFEGSETSLGFVNSVVARDDWHRPVSQDCAASLWRPGMLL